MGEEFMTDPKHLSNKELVEELVKINRPNNFYYMSEKTERIEALKTEILRRLNEKGGEKMSEYIKCEICWSDKLDELTDIKDSDERFEKIQEFIQETLEHDTNEALQKERKEFLDDLDDYLDDKVRIFQLQDKWRSKNA